MSEQPKKKQGKGMVCPCLKTDTDWMMTHGLTLALCNQLRLMAAAQESDVEMRWKLLGAAAELAAVMARFR